MSTKVLDRKNYENKTIYLIEILSSYFTDKYYNELYEEAKKLKEKNFTPSVTEAYKHTLQAFLQGISNPKFYQKALVNIQEFISNNGFYGIISYSTCIDKIVGEFIPKSYLNVIIDSDMTKKAGIINFIFTNVNKSFVESLVYNHFPIIIDVRNKDNATVLKNELIDLFLIERDKLFQRFVISQSGVKPTDAKVDRNFITKFENEFKKVFDEKVKLMQLIKNMKTIIIKKDNENKQLKQELATCQETQRHQQYEQTVVQTQPWTPPKSTQTTNINTNTRQTPAKQTPVRKSQSKSKLKQEQERAKKEQKQNQEQEQERLKQEQEEAQKQEHDRNMSENESEESNTDEESDQESTVALDKIVDKQETTPVEHDNDEHTENEHETHGDELSDFY